MSKKISHVKKGSKHAHNGTTDGRSSSKGAPSNSTRIDV